MKAWAWLVSLSILASSISDASARRIHDPSDSFKRHANPDCERIYYGCRGRHPGNVAGCEVLYAAAQKTNVWGDPDVREAAGIAGNRGYCEN